MDLNKKSPQEIFAFLDSLQPTEIQSLFSLDPKTFDHSQNRVLLGNREIGHVDFDCVFENYYMIHIYPFSKSEFFLIHAHETLQKTGTRKSYGIGTLTRAACLLYNFEEKPELENSYVSTRVVSEGGKKTLESNRYRRTCFGSF